MDELSNSIKFLAGRLPAGQKVNICRQWLSSGLPYVSVGRLPDDRELTCIVRWILRDPSGDFALLETRDWDPEDEAPPYVVVRVIAKGCFTPLDDEHQRSIRMRFYKEMASKKNLTAAALKQEMEQNFAAVFGQEDKSGLPDIASGKPAMPGLSRSIWTARGDDAVLTIADRWQEYGRAFLQVEQENFNNSSLLSVRWVVEHNTVHYLIIEQLSDAMSDSSNEPPIVMRAEGKDRLAIISTAELAAIYTDCMKAMHESQRSSLSQIGAVLGAFPIRTR